jgi:hypothetical protein
LEPSAPSSSIGGHLTRLSPSIDAFVLACEVRVRQPYLLFSIVIVEINGRSWLRRAEPLRVTSAPPQPPPRLRDGFRQRHLAGRQGPRRWPSKR